MLIRIGKDLSVIGRKRSFKDTSFVCSLRRLRFYLFLFKSLVQRKLFIKFVMLALDTRLFFVLIKVVYLELSPSEISFLWVFFNCPPKSSL